MRYELFCKCLLGDLLIFANKVRTVCLTIFKKYYYIVLKNSCLCCHIYEQARQKQIWFLKIELEKINIKKFCRNIWLAAFLKLPYRTGFPFWKLYGIYGLTFRGKVSFLRPILLILTYQTDNVLEICLIWHFFKWDLISFNN